MESICSFTKSQSLYLALMQWFLTADVWESPGEPFTIIKSSSEHSLLGNAIYPHCFKFMFILAIQVYLFSWFSDLHIYLITPLNYLVVPEQNLCFSLCSFPSIYFPEMLPIIFPIALARKRPFFLPSPFLVHQCQMLSHSSTSAILAQGTNVFT